MLYRFRGGLIFMNEDVLTKLKPIKLLALDFDGIMTDGHVYVDQDGKEMVYCSRKDGMGVVLLKKSGIGVCVITSEANSVVLARCNKLQIPCWHKVESAEGKAEVLKRIVEERGLIPKEVAFMGDDVNDLEALKYAGVALTVADGHPDIKAVAHYTTSVPGGQHAVREVCEMILKAKDLEPRY